jgi:hypothetical protein
MLEGKNVNLTILEREDLLILLEWNNNLKFIGRFELLKQETRVDLERT